MSTEPMEGYMFTASDGRVYFIGANTFRVESEHVAMSGNAYASGGPFIVRNLELAEVQS